MAEARANRHSFRLSLPGFRKIASGWLKEFMDKCKERGYRVDFIAVHCYQDFSDPNAVNSVENFFTRIYDTYKLPIC